MVTGNGALKLKVLLSRATAMVTENLISLARGLKLFLILKCYLLASACSFCSLDYIATRHTLRRTTPGGLIMGVSKYII